MNGLGSTQNPMQWLGNFGLGFLGIKPLFSNGVQIGTWSPGGGFFDLNEQDVMSSLCNQNVSFNAGVTAAQMDPTTWTTYDDWDNIIKVQDYCLQKAVVPNWMSQDQLNQYQTNPDGSITPAPSSLVVPLAIAGGLILISLLLAARR